MSELDDYINYPIESYHAGIQDDARAELAALRDEVTRLRRLIRVQQIEARPPFDVTDDLTTQFAVENAALEQAVNEARLAMKRASITLYDGSSAKAFLDDWLAAHPAPEEQAA